MTTEQGIDQFRDQQRATWAAGDYAQLSEHISQVGELVVARTQTGPGMRALDVACGTGNAARPAARAGAAVAALDLVESLLAAGREKAQAEGLEVEWIEGDAEDLPFGDGEFDRIFSTFGHMFAPRHQQVASEFRRVAAADAVIGICCWTPEGTVGDVFGASAPFMPPPPPFAEPPILWGTEEHVHAMFPDAAGFEFERHSATVEWESARGFASYFFERFGPMVVARQMLGDRFDELAEQVIAVFEERNEARDGSLVLPQEYLLSIIRL